MRQLSGGVRGEEGGGGGDGGDGARGAAFVYLRSEKTHAVCMQGHGSLCARMRASNDQLATPSATQAPAQAPASIHCTTLAVSVYRDPRRRRGPARVRRACPGLRPHRRPAAPPVGSAPVCSSRLPRTRTLSRSTRLVHYKASTSSMDISSECPDPESRLGQPRRRPFAVYMST